MENSCWMVRQAARPGRASDLFWGDHFREHQNNWMGTSLRLPGSFLPLSVCGDCGGEFKDRHSLLGTGMWTLHITKAPLYLYQCCCLVLLPWHSNCYLELVFRLTESPLYDLLTSWLAEEVLYDLQSHHILTCCVTTACLTACCGVTPQLSELMLGDMQGCSQLRCRLLSHGFAVCKILWPCDTSTFLAVYLAAGSLWKSSVSPQHKFKTLSRSVRSIFQLMPRCKGQKVQSQESVFYQGQWTVFFLTWHLLFITFFASWLLPSLLGFISSCSCAVCFCEFSIRLLKSNIALEFGLLKCHLALAPKPPPWWQPWDAV